VALGDARIFRKKTRGESLSTAVHFLVDLSSSMSEAMGSGRRGDISRRTAAIGLVQGLGDVLDEYDIPFAVDTYSTVFSVYKTYEDSWSATRRRGLFPSINGGTQTGAAMQRSMLSLMDRSEERKLLFVVTDGDTGDFDRLVSCYTEARSLGIEVVSIMLGPVIPMIQQLSDRFGFSAETVENVDHIGDFAVRKVLEAV
jgi:nitric oxide reductase activation protein